MPCDVPSANCGFRALDGSNRWFRRLALYDFDCCFLPDGRKTNPGISDPNDGYYILEKLQGPCTCCFSGECVVVESARYYAQESMFPVGRIITCPNLSARCLSTPWRSATKCSDNISLGCCNPTGELVYWELTDEISPLP